MDTENVIDIAQIFDKVKPAMPFVVASFMALVAIFQG